MDDIIITHRKCSECKKEKPIEDFDRGEIFIGTVCKQCLWMDSILQPMRNLWSSPPIVLQKPKIINLPKIILKVNGLEKEIKNVDSVFYKKSKPKKLKKSKKPNTIARIERHKEYLAEHPHLANRSREIRKSREFDAGGNRIDWISWSRILRKYGAKCLCCGATGITLAQDHVLPVSMGGKTVPENIQPLCRSCNRKKNDKFIDYRPF